jgi:hypothetical protein
MKQQEARNVPDRDTILALAQDLLSFVQSQYPVACADELPAMFLATGFLARCSALLSGMTVLITSRQYDAVGVIYRTLLETYLYGLYVTLGGEKAADELRRAMLHEAHKIDLPLGRKSKQDRPEDALQLPVSQYGGDGLVQRVDRLLAQGDAQTVGWAPRAYKHHYKITSLRDAHGGLGSLDGYLAADGSAVVVPRRDDSRLATHLLNQGVALVLSLGRVWLERMDSAQMYDLLEIIKRWHSCQPPDAADDM